MSKKHMGLGRSLDDLIRQGVGVAAAPAAAPGRAAGRRVP